MYEVNELLTLLRGNPVVDYMWLKTYIFDQCLAYRTPLAKFQRKLLRLFF
jgi:hypothetical protein